MSVEQPPEMQLELISLLSRKFLPGLLSLELIYACQNHCDCPIRHKNLWPSLPGHGYSEIDIKAALVRLDWLYSEG